MNLTIEDKGNTKHKLTVRTNGAVAIKLKSSASEEEKQEAIRRLTIVAQRMLDSGSWPSTMRGSFQDLSQASSICMQDEAKRYTDRQPL